MATQSLNVVWGVLYCNYQNVGWSEKYCLGPGPSSTASTTLADFVTRFSRFVNYRAGVLAPGVRIDWARVSLSDSPRDALACLTGPVESAYIASSPAVPPPNDPNTAIHIRLETARGKWGNRLLRGSSDAWIEDFRKVIDIGPPVAIAGLPSTPAPGSTRTVAIGQFLGLLLGDTSYVKKAPAPGYNWETDTWVNLMYRRITSRKTGRPFGLFHGRRLATI